MNREAQASDGQADLLAVSAALAAEFSGQGNWAAAAKIYLDLMEDYPGVHDVQWNACIALERSGSITEAVTCLKDLVAHHPDSFAGWQQLGRLQIHTGAAADAAECYRRVIDLRPDSVEAHAILGRLARRLGRHDEATIHCERAFDLDPTFEGLAADLAEIYSRRGDFADATRVATVGLMCSDEPTLTKVLAHCELIRMNPAQVFAHGQTLLDCANQGFKAYGALYTGLALMLLPEAERRSGREALRSCKVFAESLTGVLFDAIVAGDEPNIRDTFPQWIHSHDTYGPIATMFYLKRFLAGQGEPVARRTPLPTAQTISVRSIAAYGRFAHSIGNYLNAHFYCSHAGLTLETPDWQGHYVFALDEPLYRPDAPRRAITATNVLTEFLAAGPEPEMTLAGCDLFSPYGNALTVERRGEIRRRLQFRPALHRLFSPHLAFLRKCGDTLVAIHLRFGDMVGQEDIWGKIDLESCVGTLRDLWPTLDRPVLYLASDDVTKAKDAFGEFAPMTLADLPDVQPIIAHVLEFYLISRAEVVLITRGGFGHLAAAMGGNARRFYRADSRGAMRPSDIWTE